MRRTVLNTGGVMGACLCLALAACGDSDSTADAGTDSVAGKRVALVLPDLSIPIFQEMVEGAKRTASKHDIELLVAGSRGAEQQVNAIENYIGSNVDLIGVNPSDSTAVASGVEQANAADIPVVTLVTTPDAGETATHIAIPAIEVGHGMGEGIAEWCEQRRLDRCKVAELQGVVADKTGAQYGRGVREILAKHPGIDIVCKAPTNYDATEALNVAQNCLTSHPDLAYIFAWWDLGAASAVEAVREAGKTGKVGISGAGGACEALAAVVKGEQFQESAISGAEMGERFVDAAVRVLRGERVPAVIPGAMVSITTPMARGILDGSVDAPADQPWVKPNLERAKAGCK